MNRLLLIRIAGVAGLAGMLLGALDPLEGCVVILAGCVLAAFSAFLGQARLRKLAYAALILVAFGVAVMFVFTWIGGIGGKSGRSMWWALLILPYPIGWVLGLIGVTFSIIEFFRRPRPAV